MQNHIRYLVVDDHPEWVEQINSAVREYFEDERSFAKARIREFSALNATQANQQILAGGWDLVMLDMNLGAGAGKSRISGLDLLGEIARSNRAYFVIIVTGAVTDRSLEKIYGTETAALLRFGAMNEATKLMSPSRVRIVHKPDMEPVSAAMELLLPHLHSALDQYCSVSIERNVFRPLPGDSELWEMRYNGGPRVTLPHIEPYKMIRSALAQPDRALKVIQLMQAVAHSSGKGGATGIASDRGETSKRNLPEIDYKGHQQDDVTGEEGLDWEQMRGMSISVHAPVEMVGGTIPIEVIIGGLLNRMASGGELELKAAVESIANSDLGEEPLLAVPKVAAEWARRGEAANAEFEVIDAPGELMELTRRLAPLLAPIRKRWLAKKPKDSAPGKKAAAPGKGRLRVAQRVDTPEMRLARQHWKRFKNAIGRRPALTDFIEHILEWIPRDPTTRGHLHYRPPTGGEFMPFWLTE